jgi:hypothetical protein
MSQEVFFPFKKVNNHTKRYNSQLPFGTQMATNLETNIYSYLETSGGQSSNLYLNVVHFFNKVLIRHLWQLKTVVFLHWCLIHAALLTFGALSIDQPPLT